MLTRIRQPELMDDPYLDPDLHTEALRGLARLNSLSRGTSQLWEQLENFAKIHRLSSVRVLDLATGGGDVLINLAKRACHSSLPFEFVGVDISPTAIKFAQGKAKSENVAVSFMQLDVLQEEIPKGFDVIMTSLFTHHLDPAQVIDLFVKMRAATKHFLLINDLIRSEFSLAVIWLAARVVTTSKVVQYDGPTSVRAAYTLSEMKNMAEEAGLNNSLVKMCPPCRQLLLWTKAK